MSRAHSGRGNDRAQTGKDSHGKRAGAQPSQIDMERACEKQKRQHAVHDDGGKIDLLKCPVRGSNRCWAGKPTSITTRTSDAATLIVSRPTEWVGEETCG